MQNKVPLTFAIEFEHEGFLAWRLTARQTLPLLPAETFDYFRDPRNLGSIMPGWLEFTLVAPAEEPAVCEGAELTYTIRWLGMKLRWQSRIVDYHPPVSFTDIQVVGPYRAWQHLHTFNAVPEGTLLREELTYKIPFEAALLERMINRQIGEIFSYRAVKIAEWAVKAAERDER